MSKRVANRARMEGLVERWRRSGQSVSAFCRKQRISRDKLVYWRRRLAGGGAAGEGTELAPVRLIRSGPVDDGRLEIVLGTGDRLLVREGISPELLRDVVAVLRGC